MAVHRESRTPCPGHDQNVQYEKTSNQKIKRVKVYNNMQKARMILIQELVQK